MNKTRIDQVLSATGGELLSGNRENCIIGVKHDSRECEKGHMFVAICGENQDGHKYIPDVAKAGIKTFLVSHTDNWLDELYESGMGRDDDYNIIKVDNTVDAMGALATWYLDSLDIKKIAVTGSVGKTSTRDMIYYVMNEKYNCGRNLKNYNNNIGLPISIFQFDSSTEAAVLEMGMDAFGEIDYLSGIVKPEVGVITNIGVAHMEKLGSREGIFKAKMELTNNLASAESGGTLIFAGDEDMLTKDRTRGDYEQIQVGYTDDCDYRISQVDDFGVVGIKFNLTHKGISQIVELPIPGIHNAINGAIAVACGEKFGIPMDQAAKGLKKASLTGSRLKLVEGKSVRIIDDTYNANPASMMSALDVMAVSQAERRVAILGDMYELGQDTEALHRQVGEHAKAINIDKVIAVGELAREIAIGSEGKYFETKEELFEGIDEEIKTGDLILVKASRGMHMEDVVNRLKEI
ncbi:MAG: UDP-N-acetylmuramoyl-tripeptide--D-alanyl-D-alanine ligase [Bacillota bacterium]|nr:UDP-N-acetylmuramoyl-tripeptide--D-alanyl-D-alanine ligase [Bacillota bacterium]